MTLTEVGQLVAVAVVDAVAVIGIVLLGRPSGTRSLLVTTRRGSPVRQGRLDPDAALLIEATNDGMRPIKLNSCGIYAPNGSQLLAQQTDVTLPTVLKEGDSCLGWLDYAETALALQKMGCSSRADVIGFFKNRLGTVYRAAPHTVDVDLTVALHHHAPPAGD